MTWSVVTLYLSEGLRHMFLSVTVGPQTQDVLLPFSPLNLFIVTYFGPTFYSTLFDGACRETLLSNVLHLTSLLHFLCMCLSTGPRLGSVSLGIKQYRNYCGTLSLESVDILYTRPETRFVGHCR